jgi:saccharopine dehydrogenase (NAD+, L-lysine-forming)
MKVAVLGAAGLVAKATVADLVVSNIDVLGVDIRSPSLKVDYRQGDLRRPSEVASLIKGCDYAINAAQYYFNIQAMRACLKAGVNYVDLGGLFWMTRKQLRLNDEFERERLTALIGMGAEPGITNVAAAYLHRLEGVPEKIAVRNAWRSFSEHFRVNWSIDTQMDELSMRAPVYKNGKYVYYQPCSLSEETVFSPPIGTFRTYLTIHSELATFPTSFPGVGQVDWMEGGTGFEEARLVAKLGFARRDQVQGVSPRRYLSELLRTGGLMGYGDAKPDEWESAKVVFTWTNKRAEIEVVIPPKPELGVDATEYGAGVPSSIVVQMGVKHYGVVPPEKVVNQDRFFAELKKRGFQIIQTVSRVV